MAQLRSENLRGTLSGLGREIVKQIKATIVGYLKGGSFNSRRLADIVNIIRQNADDFSEWLNSETAKLFAPPVFRNLELTLRPKDNLLERSSLILSNHISLLKIKPAVDL